MLKSFARLFRRAPEPRAHEPHPRSTADIAPRLEAAAAAARAGHGDHAIAQLEDLVRDHPDAADAHLLLGIQLHARRRHEDARDCYVLAAHFRPDWWVPLFHLGLLALDESRFADALEALKRARDLGADDARVFNALGAALLMSEDVSGAIDCFRRAIALDPDLVQAHSNLGYVLFRDLEQYAEGAQHIERALALAPSDSTALCNWIMVLQHAGRTREALALADELLQREPDLVEARVNRALMRLAQGDFARGWADYEARKRSPRSRVSSDVAAPEWDGSPLTGRSIYVYAEQGLGDHIMFASCVPDVLGVASRCTLECHSKLERIFRRSFPHVEVVTTGSARNAARHADPTPDCKVAMGSLPLFFRRSAADFAARAGGYLHADPQRVAHWKARLAELPGRTKVGISWRGGVASTRRSLRSIPLEEWAPILSLPAVDFVSLQYADPDCELETLHAQGLHRVHRWDEAIDDYDETAALVCALDLVISVQTALVHLAGALGQKVWALIPAAPEWRYGVHGESMPWYASVRLVRQSEAGEWSGVIATVAAQVGAADRDVTKNVS